MKCSRCGKNNVEGVACCVWCGLALVQAEGKPRRRWWRKLWRIVGIIFTLMSLLFLYWQTLRQFDAPPISDDYTEADLSSVPAEFAGSYELLKSLGAKVEDDGSVPSLGISTEDANAVKSFLNSIRKGSPSTIYDAAIAHAEAIRRAWVNGKKGREIFERLAEYNEIADLTEPVSIQKYDTSPLWWSWASTKQVCYLYKAYIYTEAENGNHREAVRELIRIDSVFRKFNSNVRGMVPKLVCIAALASDRLVANHIANHTDASAETIALLAQHFTPLTDEEMSMKNVLIFEYLSFQRSVDEFASANSTMKSITQKNSTLRFYRNGIDPWIAKAQGLQYDSRRQFQVWPWLGPRWIKADPSDTHLSFVYMVYNGGSIIAQIGASMPEHIFRLNMEVMIQDDMLQIVLNKRLGRDVSLKARAYGDEYIIDVEGKRILSPGPDGRTGTEDDITMPIDPNVMRW